MRACGWPEHQTQVHSPPVCGEEMGVNFEKPERPPICQTPGAGLTPTPNMRTHVLTHPHACSLWSPLPLFHSLPTLLTGKAPQMLTLGAGSCRLGIRTWECYLEMVQESRRLLLG